MGKDVSDQRCSSRLAQIIPIVRGLRADPTGNPDIPYKPVILKSLTSKAALVFAGSPENAEAQDYPAPLTKGPKPPLFLDVGKEYREQIKNAVSDYSTQHGQKPEEPGERRRTLL